jgi:hypothetical protein
MASPKYRNPSGGVLFFRFEEALDGGIAWENEMGEGDFPCHSSI